MQAAVAAMHLPWGERLLAEARAMVKATAERFGVSAASRLSWVPIAALSLTLVLSVVSFARSFGEVQARSVAQSAESQQLLAAAGELRQTAKDLRTEVNSRLESIQNAVSASQTQVNSLQVRVDEREKRYAELYESMEMQRIQMQTLRERLAANGWKLTP